MLWFFCCVLWSDTLNVIFTLIKLYFKASSHIVFGGIWWHSTVLQYPHATIWKHSHQILNTGKYWVLRIELFLFTIPWNTLGNCLQPYGNTSDTFGNPEYLNYLLFKRFLQWTWSSNKRCRPQTICSRESIVFIWTNAIKIQIYRHLLLANQILSVFDGIWVANIKCRQILYGNYSLVY